MVAPAVITLLTDFGDQDTFAGQMRGVIAGLAPTATVIDVTHHIPPQDVLRGAITWADAVEAFPPGTIHVGVVDPGVGTARRAVAAEIGAWRFVAPDNGLLTAVQKRWPTHAAVELNRSEWHRSPCSATFHGRDVFAPAAAHWANKVPLQELGTALVAPLIELGLPIVVRSEAEVHGEVLWPDRFGNLITSITTADVPADVSAEQFQVRIGEHQIAGISRCYGDHPPGTLLALWGSSGRLEIAVAGGAASRFLSADHGPAVRVSWVTSPLDSGR